MSPTSRDQRESSANTKPSDEQSRIPLHHSSAACCISFDRCAQWAANCLCVIDNRAEDKQLTRLAVDALIEQITAAGIRWIFGNPGTTELAFVDALQDHPDLQLVLALHEGVAVGAAEGYARSTGEIGMVLLHSAPGLGNAAGMLYNAMAGQVPMLVYVGQTDQRALYQEPLLGADLVAMAHPIAKWAHQVRTADEIPQVVRRAIKVALTPPCGPVVIAVPMDILDLHCAAPVHEPDRISTLVSPDEGAVENAARLLLSARNPAFIVGDGVARSGAVDEVVALAARVGAPIFGGTAYDLAALPVDLDAGRLPPSSVAARKALAGVDFILAIGTKLLPSIFPEPGPPLGDLITVHIGLDTWELGKNQPSLPVFGDERLSVKALDAALSAWADAQIRTNWIKRREIIRDRLNSKREQAFQRDKEYWDSRPLSSERAIAELAQALPDDVYVVDESLTAFELTARYCHTKQGHWFRSRGGAIGAGMSLPIGVQVARPSDSIVAIVGDGSAMYTISSLWTAAHHKLPITYVVINNRSYRILKENTLSHRAAVAPQNRRMRFIGADLDDPPLDFVSIAKGMGVAAVRITEATDIQPAIASAIASGRPSLAELLVDSRTRHV
jgi:benzoylformate decarboxylase